MTPDVFRRLALSQPKVVEVYYRGQSEFRVLRRSFASLGGPADSVAMVQLTSEQQAAWTLAYECFGPRPHKWDWTPSRSQIKACTRAIQSIARKFPQYAIIPGRGSKGIVLYEIADPVSVLRAKMRMGTENRVGRWVVAATFEGQMEDRASRPDPVASP